MVINFFNLKLLNKQLIYIYLFFSAILIIPNNINFAILP